MSVVIGTAIFDVFFFLKGQNNEAAVLVVVAVSCIGSAARGLQARVCAQERAQALPSI